MANTIQQRAAHTADRLSSPSRSYKSHAKRKPISQRRISCERKIIKRQENGQLCQRDGGGGIGTDTDGSKSRYWPPSSSQTSISFSLQSFSPREVTCVTFFVFRSISTTALLALAQERRTKYQERAILNNSGRVSVRM